MGKPSPTALDYTPAWGFGAAPRFKDDKPAVAPGPGQYNVKTDSKTHAGFGDSPRYSISPRHERKAEQNSPGPIYGIPPFMKHAPSPVFAKSPRDKAALVSLTYEEARRSIAGQSPGPTAYDMGTTIGVHTPRFSFGSSPRSNLVQNTAGSVGPGSYSMPTEKPRGGVISRSSREHEMKKYITKDHVKALYGIESPGPGVYGSPAFEIGHTTHTNAIRNSPRAVIGGAKRFSGSEKEGKGPGPGSYNLPIPTSANGAVKFGGPPDRAQSAPAGAAPGPGSYSVPPPGSAGSVYSSSPRWRQGTGPRFTSLVNENSPGPIYSPPTDPRIPRPPAFKFGNDKKGNNAPDPTPMGPAYNPAPPQASPRWAFGTSPRPSLVQKSGTPGAGAYRVPPTIGTDANDPTIGRSPVVKIFHTGRKPLEKNDVPGPGTYAPPTALGPSPTPVYERGPMFKFGSAQRDDLGKSETPGPGAYDQSVIISRSGP